MPKAPVVERCVLDLKRNQEICQMYKFDVVGGERIGKIFKRPITDRSVTFPLKKSWEPMVNWRDDLMLWYDDLKGRSVEEKNEICSEALDYEVEYDY